MLDYGPVALFNTFGYLRLPGVFNAAEVERMTAEFDAAIAAAAGNGNGGQKGEQCVSPWGSQDGLGLRLLADDRIADVARRVLGFGALLLRVRCRRLTADLPWQGGGELVPWPLQHVTAAVALDRAGAGDGDGCLRFVPCSHRNYLRLLDPRWQQAPDYLYGLRNPRLRWDHNALGVTDERVPALPAPTEPGDVVIYTPDVLHAALGVSAPRRLIEVSYAAEPRTAAQVHFLRQWDASTNGEPRVPQAIAASADPTLRELAAGWRALGFDPEARTPGEPGTHGATRTPKEAAPC